MALLFIDLDRFKPVNDALGHTVGDLLLKAVAERLLKCVQRESDTVARVGGDEFVVLLMGMDNLPDAWTVAVKIRDALAQPFYLEPHTVPISASIGIAIFPDHGSDGASLIKHADAAMYQAKASGRNQIMIFTPDLVARAPIERDDDDLPTQWQSL
jgi:diguanylate cyclase (GGDEF)-like protein